MPSLAVNDVPEGVPRLSAGGVQVAAVPTVAAARATGLPITSVFRPAINLPAPVNTPAQPQTALQRITALGDRAKIGLQTLLGLTPTPPQPAVTAVDASAALEKQLDELQKRSTTTVFQMRQKAANAKGSSY